VENSLFVVWLDEGFLESAPRRWTQYGAVLWSLQQELAGQVGRRQPSKTPEVCLLSCLAATHETPLVGGEHLGDYLQVHAMLFYRVGGPQVLELLFQEGKDRGF